MQTKSVQISSTTLGLRFMQNAKIKQEQRKTEVAQVKIQNEEQWHLEVPEEQGESSKHTDDHTKRVIFTSNVPCILYESSYLPFLFPDSQPNAEEEDNQLRFKGRRAFGKYGKEKEIQIDPTPLPEPSVLEGNSEAQSQDTVSTSPRPPLSKPRSTHKSSAEPKADPPSRLKDGLRAFLRPNVEAPKTSKRNFEHTSEPARKRKKKAEDRLTEHP